MAKVVATQEDAMRAEAQLVELISKFSSEARAPWEQKTPDLNPTWTPRTSTLRYSPIKGGGLIWSMDAKDQQIVAYYIEPYHKAPFGVITMHGQSRSAFHNRLKSEHIYPTQVPWTEWYDYKKRYELDRGIQSARKEM